MRAGLVAIAKDEGSFVFEWILYHAFMGFDAVVVFDNNSSDDTAARVAAAGAHADARLLAWPRHPGQIEAYNFALDEFGDEFDVFCMLDVDEFLVPLRHDDLRPILGVAQDHPFVAVNWFMYGSAGHIARPSDLVTESYGWRGAKANLHVKTIVGRAGFGSRFHNPHFMRPGTYVDADGRPVAWHPGKAGGKLASRPEAPAVRINHYHVKSREDYDLKLRRGRATTTRMREDRFAEGDLNDVYDPVIPQRFPHVLQRIKDAS